MKISWLGHAWRNLWRDARAGELNLLVGAVVLGVAGLSAVSFLADRLERGLQRDAAQLLGGDVVIASDQELPPEFARKAQSLGLQAVRSASFPTMARTEATQASRLIALKAVESGYPLRGRLGLASQLPQSDDAPAERWQQSGPPSGEAWAEPALFEALGLKPGDRLWLGQHRVVLSQVLLREPDRGAGFMNFAPRVLIAADDLAATGLVQPASRVAWRFALTGTAPAIAQYKAWAMAQTELAEVRGVRVESLESGRPEMQQTLDRAGKFLHLVALLAALLSAVAVALAARAFAHRRLDDAAMLRVLGVTQSDMARAYALEFALVGSFASILGLALGAGVHAVLVDWLGSLLSQELPPPGWKPVALGLGVGLTLLLAFGLPPVLQLAQVPPLRVMRRELGDIRPGSRLAWALGVLGFGALLAFSSQDRLLALWVVAGFAGAWLLFALCTRLALVGLRRVVREGVSSVSWILATRQLASRPGLVVIQVGALALGLLALLLLTVLRTDLMASWRAATPSDAPNRFVINIQPDQAQAFEQMLAEAGVRDYDWYPMARGRLVGVNGRTVRAQDFVGDRAQRLADREWNLSYHPQLPPHNPVEAGRWIAGEPDAISLEQGIAKTLGVGVGDRLQFDLAGILLESRITSIRRVDWSSMRANFFGLYPQAALPPGVPVTYLAAFRAPAREAGGAGFDNRLVNRFPNVTVVDLGASIAQAQQILGQVSAAIEILFAFTLLSGGVVLLAALVVTREARARDYAVLRAVGASHAVLARMQGAELLGVGLLAGALASLAALGIGWGLAQQVFDFPWQPRLWLPLAGMGAGAGLAWVAGSWTLRTLLRQPVAQTLRQLAS